MPNSLRLVIRLTNQPPITRCLIDQPIPSHTTVVKPVKNFTAVVRVTDFGIGIRVVVSAKTLCGN